MAETREALIARELDRIMRRACDRVQPHRTKPGIVVQTVDWHALMDLANEARAALNARKDETCA
jgi:hypothetical protein